MFLDKSDMAMNFKLYFDLLHCVNKKHKIVRGLKGGRYLKSVDTSDAFEIREKLFDNPSCFDEYLAKYGNEFSEEERDILVSWRNNFIRSEFFNHAQSKKAHCFYATGE